LALGSLARSRLRHSSIEKVADFTKNAQNSKEFASKQLPKPRKLSDLLQFVGMISSSDLERIRAAVEEDLGQIDPEVPIEFPDPVKPPIAPPRIRKRRR
jgi:hypothetical protein